MGEKELVMKKVKEFVKKLSKDLDVTKVILFGSRATGDASKDSDIDLIIVSKDFKGLGFFRRVYKMYDYWDIDYSVDFICYTPEEFNKLSKRITLVSQALKEGIEIK